MGTTAYAWTYRPEEIRAQSLESFTRYGFNKIRMLVFPKEYGDGKSVDASYDPPCFPYEGSPGAWDYTRFNPAFFQNFEARVNDLLQRDIQADVILFHPYDCKWLLPQGMTEADDIHYTRCLVARLAAYRNVWWSLANEFVATLPFQSMTVNWLQTDGRDLYCLHQADNAFLFFIGPDYKDRNDVWIESGRETPAQCNLIVHDIWNCVETERRTVGKGQVCLTLPSWAAVTALKIL